MSDEIRKGGAATPEAEAPKDDQLFTPQGGGGGTGAGPMGSLSPKEPEKKSLTLPQVGSEEEAPAPDAGAHEEEDGVSSFRLLMTLGVAGALSGAILVFVFLWSQPKILAYQAMVIQQAVTEVLKGPDHFESLFLEDGKLVTVAQVSAGVDTLDLDRVFLGYDADGAPIGFAMEAEGFGFQDIIGLIFGYDAASGQVLGMKVLRHLETPGLGDKIVKDLDFVSGFDGAAAPIQGVKPDRNTGDPTQVDMITGATISSKAVIRIINDRIAQMEALLAAYEPANGVQGEGQ